MPIPARGKRPNQRGMAVAARSSADCAYASIAPRVRKLNLESPRSRFSTGVTSRDPKFRSVMPRISASSSETVARPSRWIESGDSVSPLVQHLVQLLDHDAHVALRRRIAQPQPLALIRHLARDVEGNRLPPGEGLR